MKRRVEEQGENSAWWLWWGRGMRTTARGARSNVDDLSSSVENNTSPVIRLPRGPHYLLTCCLQRLLRPT